MPRNQYDLESRERAERAIAQTARLVLAGELGIIAASRKLWRLGHDVVADWRDDEDFRLFGAIDSETDHLPLEDQRALWAPGAFAERQAEVARLEATYRADALAACARLVDRFGAV